MDNQGKVIRIALDAMGGDFSPANEIVGAVRAYSEKKSNIEFEIVFVGDETQIKTSLSKLDTTGFKYSIVHTDETVTMDDDPTIALKTKKQSSMYKGLELHAQHKVDAFLSAGNTGAVMATATVLLGRINGVSRPTIGAFFPTSTANPALVLDVGANIDSKPRFLYEYAVMGEIYGHEIIGIKNPRVAILNIGEEEAKGTETIHQAYDLLKNSSMNFIGNIEGGNILLGGADVIVCDGFIGNTIMKFAESFFTFIKIMFKQFADKSIFNKIAIVCLYPIMKKIFSEFDYEKHGGVPLLGVNGVGIIGHGKSTPLAFQNMIYTAIDLISLDVNKKIELALTNK